MLKGFTRNIKPLDLLTEEQVESIHRGAMEVLEDTGVKVEHDKALKLLAEHGCNVDFENQRVRMPTWLVEESLRKCPSSYMIKARDSQNDVRIGGNTMYFLQGMGIYMQSIYHEAPLGAAAFRGTFMLCAACMVLVAFIAIRVAQ